MTDSSLPPLPSDDAPIDAEFEPAERAGTTAATLSGGPGWMAFGILFLQRLHSLRQLRDMYLGSNPALRSFHQYGLISRPFKPV